MRDVERVIGDCAVYDRGMRRSDRMPLPAAAETAKRTEGFVWIGLQRPTEADLAEVAEQFELPGLAVEDAVQSHQRPKLEVYHSASTPADASTPMDAPTPGDTSTAPDATTSDGYVVFVVLRPVTYVDSKEVVRVEEISMFLGEHFVVSVRHGDTGVLRQVRAELDSGRLPSGLTGPTGVLHRTADLIVDQYMDVSANIDDDVAEIEGQVFGEKEGDHAERIYKLKREVLEFRRSVLPLIEPLHRLTAGTVPGIDPESKQWFRDVLDHALRAAEEIERHDALLSDILQANMTRVSVSQSLVAARQSEVAVRQNEDMRKISAWAAIALVPTAIAGIYGMNFEVLPELTWRYGYVGVLSVIAAACYALHRAFRHNGWL